METTLTNEVDDKGNGAMPLAKHLQCTHAETLDNRMVEGLREMYKEVLLAHYPAPELNSVTPRHSSRYYTSPVRPPQSPVNMQLQYFPIIATLLAATQASPIAMEQLEARQSINDCGDSSFENQSSGGSPWVADCQQIVRNIQSEDPSTSIKPSYLQLCDTDGGSWQCSSIQRQLVSYGSCAFGCTANTFTWVGNSDISDLINDSIGQFSWSERVGSKGSMTCGGVAVRWGLYHT